MSALSATAVVVSLVGHLHDYRRDLVVVLARDNLDHDIVLPSLSRSDETLAVNEAMSPRA
jgi:hypothetical protein